MRGERFDVLRRTLTHFPTLQRPARERWLLQALLLSLLAAKTMQMLVTSRQVLVTSREM